MSTETASFSSRRAVLVGAIGGMGALVASAVGRTAPARATNGDAMLVGNVYTSTAPTKITNSTTGDDVLAAESTNNGAAILGTSSSGIGVYGDSQSATGVLGASQSGLGLWGSSQTYYGVYGQSNNSIGVKGLSTGFASCRGVVGETNIGHGVHGIATSGYAGFFEGKVFTTKYHEMKEISAPSAPAMNRARLFLKDDGTGKTQLCVRFNTGAVQVLATQP